MEGKELSMAEALDLAMQAELEAEALYLKAGAASQDPRGRHMFKELAKFERHHFQSLRELRDDLMLTRFKKYEGFELQAFRATDPPAALSEAERRTDVDAIGMAIAAEIRARLNYADLAEQFGSQPLVSDLFTKLAREEELHEKVLQDQYFALSNRGHWTWGE